MPGTPDQTQQQPKEDIAVVAHRRAISMASLYADPIFNPRLFSFHYWNVMAGYGYRPYVIGGIADYHAL